MNFPLPGRLAVLNRKRSPPSGPPMLGEVVDSPQCWGVRGAGDEHLCWIYWRRR